MDKPAITLFFTGKGKVLDFEIQRANKRLVGAVVIPSGIFKLELCSFDISEGIELLQIVRAVALNSFKFVKLGVSKGAFPLCL